MDKRNQPTREEQEKDENLKTLSHDVPSSRFQKDQQVNPVSEGENTETVKSEYSKKKVSGSGARVKQQVAAKILSSTAGGDAIGDDSGVTFNFGYDGGSAGHVASSAAYTPVVKQSRSDSRYGKKLDAVAKKLNFVPSEQVEVEFDESKPLAKSPEAVMGYNGTYRNTNARSQKTSGGVPGSLLFMRSVDEISRDQMYFAEGQVINDPMADRMDTPTLTAGQDDDGNIKYDAYDITRGNYHNKFLNIKFNDKGKLEAFYFTTTNLECSVSNPQVLNMSSTNAIIDMNAAEMDRQRMDDKAGDEKADLWTPLARAIKEPSQTVAYLRDLESITGSEVWMAYKKLALAHSYQLNRARKDGQDVSEPMLEAVLGCIYGQKTKELYNVHHMFDGKNYAQGSADLYLGAMDTIRKYKTKADLLLQPRSFKAALQVADNNMNPLRLKATFAQVVNNREVFSTIDRGYDPLLPVCISDKEALIHCYDFNDLYAWTERTSSGKPKFMKDPFKYAYSDLRNFYLVDTAIPLLKGIADYLEDNAFSYINAQSLINGSSYKPTTDGIVIPIVHSTTSFSLWDLIVCAATPYIAKARVNSMRDVLYYEKNVEYPFSQLISIAECNPMNAVNYGHNDYNAPIEIKTMMPSVAITWLLPEMHIPFDESTEVGSGATYSMILPWYFNEKDFVFSEGKTLYRDHDSANMTMFSIRDGVRLSYFDDIFSMEERDLRLCLDRLTDIVYPADDNADSGVYKYDQNSDGIPYTTYKSTDLTYKKYLSLPREQGFFLVAPGSWLSPMGQSGSEASDVNDVASDDDPMYGQTSYRIKCWTGYSLSLDQGILNPDTIQVSRAKAYVQTWYVTDCMLPTESAGKPDNGFLFAMGELFDSDFKPIEGKGLLLPFTKGYSTGISGAQVKQTDSSRFGLLSTQKALWTRIQKLPFIISPFDAACNYIKVGEDAIKTDPFDLLYSFGLCGFRASDYREDVYNRENQIVEQGNTYLWDPWIRANPIFKESISLTETQNAGKLSYVSA